jgi:gliding motility-associated-like protein
MIARNDYFSHLPHTILQEGETIEFVIMVYNLGTEPLENADVHYRYNKEHLTYTENGDYHHDAALGEIYWKQIVLGAGQAEFSSPLVFTAKKKGLVVDTAWIDSASLRSTRFGTYEDYMAKFNNLSVDSIWIHSDFNEWTKQNTVRNEIMTMFSPNGDGINDYFVIQELYDPKFADNELLIFDRYGNAVFHERPYNQKWDAAELPDGVYFYRLNLWFDGKKQQPIMGPIEVRRKQK